MTNFLKAWKEYAVTLRHDEKINSMNYKDKIRRRIPGQWNRLDLQQDHRRKFLQTKKRHTHRDTRST